MRYPLIGALIVLLACRCSSFQAVDVRLDPGPAETRAAVAVGDTVEVRTERLGTTRFKVTEIDDQGISGTGVRVARSEIQSIAVRRVDAGRTVLLGAIVLGTVLVVGFVSLLRALGAS